MMQQSSTSHTPHEPPAIRDCKFYIYEGLDLHMHMSTTRINDAANLEGWLRQTGSLPPTAKLDDPNLVMAGVVDRQNSHRFLLHALMKHPKRSAASPTAAC